MNEDEFIDDKEFDDATHNGAIAGCAFGLFVLVAALIMVWGAGRLAELW